ncbi:MAG TPA: cupin domain-containing protein [Herpetosiphonaceae bacterium]|nr:cupin domain-containing protein [Herpetosiphonaceae bacterium]
MSHHFDGFALLAGGPAPLDLAALIAGASHDGPIWSHTSDQFNLNLLRFRRGDGVPAHRNGEVDVLIAVVAGEGTISIDGQAHAAAAGSIVLIPRGSERSITATGDQFAYLSCHQRRGGLQPTLPAAAPARD